MCHPVRGDLCVSLCKCVFAEAVQCAVIWKSRAESDDTGSICLTLEPWSDPGLYHNNSSVWQPYCSTQSKCWLTVVSVWGPVGSSRCWWPLLSSIVLYKTIALNGTVPKLVMLRPGQLLYTAATFAINNVAGSRHGGKDDAESGVFKVDIMSVNIYHIPLEYQDP